MPRGRVQIPGGQTEGFINPTEEDDDQEPATIFATERMGDHYAEQYKLEEEEEELNMLKGNQPGPGMSSDFGDCDELTSMGTMPNLAQLKIDEMDNTLFNDYRLKPGEFQKLPVFQYQTKLLGLINSNPVVVIEGRTGCGKSTQVPLMILDDYAQRKQFCNIIVTQPRRIAAMSVTNTVCKIYNMKLGSLIGYQIGLDRQVSPQTRLTYCTTGVLLQKLVRAKSMDEYTHIILDEVHERTQEMDFLMLLVRKLQKTKSRNVKIVLMSATINVDRYAQYFSTIVNQNREAAPVITIEKESNFKVHEFYIDDLEYKLGPFPESERGDHDISPDAYGWIVKLIKAFDYIDEKEKKMKGSVLVFLPGIYEIESMFEALTRDNDAFIWWICPLHSTITADEQMKVFQPPPKNKRKIILSTNIAESSITVNDIKYVIDLCLTKSMRLDEETNLSTLKLCSASRSMCEQRAGRAGRVMDGRVYRLVSKHFYNNCLPKESSPEMLNASLELTVLKAKQLEMGEPKKILALAMDPPDLTNLKKTILKLKELGAMFMKIGGKYSEDDGDLTVMGLVMASLPLDVHMTKLILLGHAFNCLNDAIIMACSMSVKSMFSRPFKKDLESYTSKLTWGDSMCSDPIACVNAYNTWRSLKTSGKFNLSAGEAETSWAQRYFIQLLAMREVARLAEEVTMRLRDFNVVETRPPSSEKWNRMKPYLQRIILAGACYPNFFIRGEPAGQINEREAVKLLGSRDPLNTVYLTNFPLDQPGPLYASAIKKIFLQCGVPSNNIKISFDGSSRVYVEFKWEGESSYYDGAHGKVLSSNVSKIFMAVYRAVKLRHGKVPLLIPMLAVDEANKRVNLARIDYLKRKKSTTGCLQSILPSIDQEYIDIEVTHINSLTNFYAQQKNPYTSSRMNAYHDIMNNQGQLKRAQHVVENEIYAAPFLKEESGVLYRCKVLSIDKRLIEVIYLDYGNIDKIEASFMYIIPSKGNYKPRNGNETLSVDLRNEPPLAFQCRLAHIQPVSSTIKVRGKLVNEAVQFFTDICLFNEAVGKVYSVVENIVSMEILLDRGRSSSLQNRENDYMYVTKILLEKAYAKPGEESFRSKNNHDSRLKHQSKYNSYNNAPDYEEENAASEASTETLFDNDSDLEMKSPTFNEAHSRMHLKGPFSPLEMKIRGCLRSSINKAISIEKDSINSVLLDPGPEDPHERMLVAGHVSRSAGGDRLNLRHTTLLPDIAGLPAFLCLLFSPYVELRTDERVSRLTGAICGLGYDPDTCKSYFPEHDFEIAFDTVFSIKDIELINKIRNLLSLCLAPFGETAYFSLEITEFQATIFKLLDSALIRLANQPPERVKTCNTYKWGQIDAMHLMQPGTEGSMKVPLIYNLIYGVQTSDSKRDIEQMRIEFQKNIDDIVKIKDGLKPFKPMSCELCQVSLDNIQILRLHFMSTQHKDLSKRFKLNNPKE